MKMDGNDRFTYTELLSVKKALRHKAKIMRKERSSAAEDEIITARLLEFLSTAPRDARVLVYFAITDEFPTLPLMEKLLLRRPDIQLYIPRVECSVQEGACMNGYRLPIKNDEILWSALERDNWGIWQTRNSADVLHTDFEAKAVCDTFVVVPGLLFDTKGGRIGYGGGYYDRYLQRLSGKALTLAPCRGWQLYEEDLPWTPGDQAVDLLVCADKILRTTVQRFELTPEQHRLIH